MRLVTTAAVLLLGALCVGCTSGPVRFRHDLGSFVERLRASDHAPPGFVVVAIHRNQTVFEGAYGVRDVATGVPMSLDTPIYNASVTKAYTGVLAAVLDARGELPLSTSLRDVWPELTLPAGLDPAAITASRLLSHSFELRAGGLIYRSVTTGEVSAQDVPAHLQRFATRTEPGFSYSNLGPFVYSAMVERKTGTPWREAIARNVFEPLGLRQTAARLEDVESQAARCHYWQDGAWHGARFKPTITMNAAGGMYSSGRDTGRFLQAFVSDADAVGGISSATLRSTWRPVAQQDRDVLGIHRDGYGLGWDLGTYDGHRFVSRSGGYTGCRAIALFLPTEQFGIAVLSVGDTGVNAFNSAMVRQAIDYWVGAREQRAAERIREYQQAAATEFAQIAPRERPPRAVEPELAQAILGTFQNERLGRVLLTQESGGLVLRAGVWTADLEYQGDTAFIAIERGTNNATALHVVRAASGGVTSIILDDDRFDRVVTIAL